MTINNEEVKIPEITFGMVCDLYEKKGIDIKAALIGAAQFSAPAIRTFVSLAYNFDEKKASEAIDSFISEGGDFADIIAEINEAVEKSSFFQAWLRTMEKTKAIKKK
jgi:hypothetical protein